MTSDTAFQWVTLLVGDDDAPEPDRNRVGGKAWSLWRMQDLGLRVPPAFVIGTDACSAYMAAGGEISDALWDEALAGVERLEAIMGRRFGGDRRPLLVSVRSGAPVSMPGMMDTILNLGVNDDVERALAAEIGHPEVAADLHRRFCAMYGDVVLGSIDHLDELPDAAACRAAVEAETGRGIPSDAREQLRAAIAAVFDSSRSRRATTYRRHYGLPDDLGTAVTVQAMVFGNLDDRSGTGVLFSRNPATGAPEPFGEYLARGQGEDVVNGRTTPRPLSDLRDGDRPVYDELVAGARTLDGAGRDAQDVEFTIQSGTLYFLQSRPAKRTPAAAIRIALELVREGAIDEAEALRRVQPDHALAVLRARIAPGAEAAELASGIPACPGVATGTVVATSEDAERDPGAILARPSTSPNDIHGMIAAAGIVTERGGATSHAAVVSRALDRPCVVGCGDGVVERLAGRAVTVDGTAGKVYDGALPLVAPDEDDDPDLRALAALAERFSPVTVLRPGDPGAEAVGVEVAAEDVLGADGRLLDAPALPSGVDAVRGSVLADERVVEAVIAAGVRAIVVERRLPALLAAARSALRETTDA